jgi:GYF domain 2
MAERSWFFASNGQQQGPIAETQFRDLIARGSVTPDTLVWTEGMAGWQRAGEIPGLMTGARPPAMPQSGPPPVMAAGGGHGGSTLSIDFGIWELFWRGLVASLGMLLVIPGPWLIVWFLNWIVPRVRVPGRPNLGFTGNAMTLVPWYFGGIVLIIAAAYYSYDNEVQWPNHLVELVQILLYWLFIRWLIANLASNGQPLGLSFAGSFWAYLGWNILFGLSILTIIGWAWVMAAQARWLCRNIEGTRRQVVYHGTGLQNLWRTLVFVICCAFIIPIPWMYRWMMRWQLSQTELVARV